MTSLLFGGDILMMSWCLSNDVSVMFRCFIRTVQKRIQIRTLMTMAICNFTIHGTCSIDLEKEVRSEPL